MTFTRHQKGCYHDLLMAQFSEGHMTLDDVKTVLGIDFESHWEVKLKGKFQVDAQGRFFNQKLEDEINKRKNFTESRRSNRTSKEHMKNHMSPHMENGNGNDNRALPENEGVFNQKENFEHAWAKYPVKDGKKAAVRSFNASVHNQAEMDRLMSAMTNYLKSEKVLKGFTKNGSTWFANWKDWETYIAPAPQAKPLAEMVAATCRASKMDKIQTKQELLKKGYSEHRADEAIMTAWGDRK